MVGRRARAERDASTEPCRDRVGFSDGTRGEHGACDVHREGSERADRLRSDGVGVGDISAVPFRAWSIGHSPICDDGRAAKLEFHTSLVSGHYGYSCGFVDKQFTHDGRAASFCPVRR
jgi:hypothetical protein